MTPRKNFVPGRGLAKIMRKAEEHHANIRSAVLRGVAWFWPSHKIIDFVKKQYGTQLKPWDIENFKGTDMAKELIERYRDEYVSTISEIPLSHKRKRLEELQEMYEGFKKENKLGMALKVLGEFREECEAKRADLYLTNVNNYTYNEFKSMTDEEIDKEYIKLLEQRKHFKITEAKDEDRKDEAQDV